MKRRESKCRYIFVNSEDIQRFTYITKREFSYNDFDNVYYKTGEETLDAIFDLYQIPEEFRKIIIKYDSPLLFRNKAEDYITNAEYNVTNINKDDKLYVSGSTQNIYFYNKVYFESFVNLSTIEEVKEFFDNLKENGIFDDYINAVASFYRENVRTYNIDRYNEIMNQYHNGKYGNEIISLFDLLSYENEYNLINNMNLYELHYIVENINDENKDIFLDILNCRLENRNKVRSLKKINNN